MPWKPIPTPTKEEIAESRRDRKKTRFLVDESVDPGVAELLRRSGWNARHVNEVGLAGHSDEDVVALAHREDRIVLTHDPDFLDDRAFPHHRNPGIVILPGAEGNRRLIVNSLNWILRTVGISRNLWRATKISISSDGTWLVNTYERDYGRVVQTKYRLTERGGIEIWEDEGL